jgi:hypothetical protein
MEETPKTTTSPPDKIHEASRPAGQGDLDKEALEKGRERWELVLK